MPSRIPVRVVRGDVKPATRSIRQSARGSSIPRAIERCQDLVKQIQQAANDLPSYMRPTKATMNRAATRVPLAKVPQLAAPASKKIVQPRCPVKRAPVTRVKTPLTITKATIGQAMQQKTRRSRGQALAIEQPEPFSFVGMAGESCIAVDPRHVNEEIERRTRERFFVKKQTLYLGHGYKMPCDPRRKAPKDWVTASYRLDQEDSVTRNSLLSDIDTPTIDYPTQSYPERAVWVPRPASIIREESTRTSSSSTSLVSSTHSDSEERSATRSSGPSTGALLAQFALPPTGIPAQSHDLPPLDEASFSELSKSALNSLVHAATDQPHLESQCDTEEENLAAVMDGLSLDDLLTGRACLPRGRISKMPRSPAVSKTRLNWDRILSRGQCLSSFFGAGFD